MAWVPAVLVLLASCASDAPQDSLRPAGPIAHKIDHLFKPVFWLAVVPIFLLVEGLVIATVVRHRHRPGRPDPIQVHGNAKLELGWTVLPALLLIGVLIPTVFTVFSIDRQPSGNVENIEVYGHMWWWEYHYPTEGIWTASELVIPAGRPVRLSLNSIEPNLPAPPGAQFATGVIHSFWVPRLAGKQDVVPGRTNKLTIEAYQPGNYRGQCAQYCNLSHANMRLDVIAKSEADFAKWVSQQQQPITPPPEGTAAYEGYQLFSTVKPKPCISCHTMNGIDGATARVGPSLTHLQSRSKFAGWSIDLTADNLRQWLHNPSAMKPMRPDQGTGMPNLHLSPDQINQLVAFLETLH